MYYGPNTALPEVKVKTDFQTQWGQSKSERQRSIQGSKEKQISLGHILQTKRDDFELEIGITGFESAQGWRSIPFPLSMTGATLEDSTTWEKLKLVPILTIPSTRSPSRVGVIFTKTCRKCSSSLLNILFPTNLYPSPEIFRCALCSFNPCEKVLCYWTACHCQMAQLTSIRPSSLLSWSLMRFFPISRTTFQTLTTLSLPS